MTIAELVAALPQGPLSDAIRIRMDHDTKAALDRVEADLRDRGLNVNRSVLVRLAIRKLVADVEGGDR